jgi:hypothetical protein
VTHFDIVGVFTIVYIKESHLIIFSKIVLDNSCGPINIEYPEFLTKVPAFASGYLQGDVVRFDCFQTHWIKGDYEYKCGLVVDYNNPSQWRFEWNKGSQPVC